MTSASGDPEPFSSSRELRFALGVAFAALLVFLANGRAIDAGDTFPARYLPFEILHHHSVTFEQALPLATQGRGPSAFWIVPVRGRRWVSLYPIVLPVLATPLYIPAALFVKAHRWDIHVLDRAARVMEKLLASLLAAATTGLVYLVARRRASTATSLFLALVFALGTTTWVISSQALWQHGLGQLLAAASLLLVTGRSTPGRIAAFGAVCGLLAANRPPDTILAAPLVLLGLSWASPRKKLLVASAAVAPLLVLAYNLAIVGHVIGGYAVPRRPGFFQHPFLPGLAGILLSPAKGLLVYSPFLLAIPVGIRALRREEPRWRRVTLAAAAAVLLQVAFYANADWRAGASWGPRWMTDALPLLFWMLPPVLAAAGPWGRALFAAGCAAAVAVEAIGAFWYTGASDPAILKGPEPSAAWSLPDAPFVSELRHPRAPADLCSSVTGFLDTLARADGSAGELRAGDGLTAEGWTLVDGRTPWSVTLAVDGTPAAATLRFFPRPDVAAALGTAAPAGWRETFSTAGIAPGAHVLAVSAQGDENGKALFVIERRFRLNARTATAEEVDLEAAARRAAEALRKSQSPAGYWLTSFTNVPRFERPSREMNTFLTAMLVDLLEPVADEAGLRDGLASARRHLTAQIEPNGLVRYHGLPDAPTIGTLGCAITPDADDTALTWRVAPAGRREALREALATLKSYRTADGLYRTWLAPRERYQCIDPGADPDPADVAIQMHVLLLLAKEDPGAARALAAALAKRLDDDAIWVYYRRAPLVPLLRQRDLAAAGFSLRVPEARTRAFLPEQEAWVSACRLLGRPARADAEPLLRALARDDFASLRAAPPLLYHNDLSASVARFYWSEDFGYALWLRLHHALGRR